MGPDYIKKNLLPALQMEGKIELQIQEKLVHVTKKGKEYCNLLGIL